MSNVNSVATHYPALAEEWDYEYNGNCEPDQTALCYGKKVYWKCPNCGKTWCTTVANRIRGVECPCRNELSRLLRNELPFLMNKAAASNDKLKFVQKYLSLIIAERQNMGTISDAEKQEVRRYLKELWDVTHMRVRDMWKRSGVTQVELAKKLALSTRTLSDWCTGARTPPRHVRLMMARLLGYMPVYKTVANSRDKVLMAKGVCV